MDSSDVRISTEGPLPFWNGIWIALGRGQLAERRPHVACLGHPDTPGNQELVVELVLRSSRRQRDRLQDVALAAPVRADKNCDTAKVQGEVWDGLEIIDLDFSDHWQSSSGECKNGFGIRPGQQRVIQNLTVLTVKQIHRRPAVVKCLLPKC